MPANGIELAKAYVQIVPSADGIQGELEKAMGSAGEKAGETGGKGIASGIGKVVGGIGKAAAAGLAATATGIAGITTAAIGSYAEFEQLSGGVEKLYGTAADQIMQYANQAYATAGMSANEYMETATSFSASLINSLGGDVDEAAKMTDVAMRAMSDNVNVFGSDMESVSNAFMGFSKQNYTMLDNLKLGYGGTKSEMERLIADANEYRASIGETSDLSIDSFADVVQAIQSIQEAQNIAGTTGKEAMTTIEGSATATKAAWQNLLTAIGTGQGLDEALDALLTSIFGGENGGGLLNNILPRVEKILSAIGEFLPKAAPVFITAIGNLVLEILPSLAESAGSVFSGLVDGILAVLPTLISYLPQLLSTFIDLVLQIAEGIIQNLPMIIQTIVEALPVILPKLIDGIVALFVMLCENFQAIIDPIIQALPDIINAITDALIDNLPLIIYGIVMLIAGIVKEIPALLVGIWETITHFFSKVWEEWVGPVFEKVGGFFREMWDAVVQGYTNLWNGIVGIFQGAANWFDENVVQPVVNFFKGLWDGIVYWFDTIIGPWIEIAKRAFLAFKENVIDPLAEWFKNLWEGIKNAAQTAWNFISGIWNAVSGWFNEHVIQPIAGFFSKMWEGVSGAAKKAWEGIKSVFSPIVEWFRGVFSKAWQAVKNVFSAGGRVFEGIKEGIVSAFKTVVNAIIRGLNKVIALPFNAINAAFDKLRGLSILKVQPFSWLPTLNVPQIPELAAGGVLEKGRMGLLEGTGAEAVVPLEKNTGWIKRVAQEMSEASPGDFTDAADEIIDAIRSMKLYIDGRILAGGIAGEMDQSLGGRSIMAGRGVATV